LVAPAFGVTEAAGAGLAGAGLAGAGLAGAGLAGAGLAGAGLAGAGLAGAPAGATGVIEPDTAEATEVPAALVAVTVKV